MSHIRFGDCEIHLSRRELLRQGRRQDLPPKAYQLLLTLVRHRDRVVTKQELLKDLWGREQLSPSVLGRTVMLVRRAIGDTAGEPRWIQSLHGVGYRFIGEATGGGQAVAEPPPLPPQGEQRVAVLPCDNATGDAACAWADFGLMALVGRALAAEAQVSLLSPAEVLRLVAPEHGEHLPAEQAWAAMELLGLSAVVHPRLTRQGAALWLEYRIYRRGGDVQSGSLRGDELVSLAERLATDLMRSLRLPRRGLPPGDPFIAQAWARAAELHGQGEHAAARPLLEVVCRHEPRNADAAVLHLDCLARLRAADADALAQLLLVQADREGDARLRAHVLATLAMAPGGTRHRALALELSAPFIEQEWAQELRLDAAAHARIAGDVDTARRLLAALEATQARLGCSALRARVDEEMAALDFIGGEIADAQERLERSIAFERRLHRRARLAQALSLLACVKLAQGLLDRAVAHVDEAMQLARDIGLPADAQARLLLVCRERLDSDRIRQMLALQGPRCEAVRLAAAACLSLAQEDLRGARTQLYEAASRALLEGQLPLLSWLVPAWLRLETACGHPQAAECARDRAGPLGGHPLMQAWAWHAQATQAWRSGDLPAARKALQHMADGLPAGRELACTQLDLAWCALEMGEAPAAERLLGGLGPWLREHPAGLAAHARRLHALGCHAEAAAAQQAALRRHVGAPPPAQQALHEHYLACSAGAAPARRPALPVLPSDAWLPLQDVLTPVAP